MSKGLRIEVSRHTAEVSRPTEPRVLLDVEALGELADQEYPDPPLSPAEHSMVEVILANRPENDPDPIGPSASAKRRDRRKQALEARRGNIERSGPRWPQNPDEIVDALQDYKAVQLRIAGFSWKEICEVLVLRDSRGALVPKRAQAMVQRGQQRWCGEDVAMLRGIELERLDALTRELWPIIENDEKPDRQLRAIERYILVSDRRAKLAGLDAAPTPGTLNVNVKSDSKVVVEVAQTVADYIDLVTELVDEIAPGSARLALGVGEEVIDVEEVEVDPAVYDEIAHQVEEELS